MPDVITNTLSTGSTLSTAYTADFGEIIIAALLLIVAALVVLEQVIKVITHELDLAHK